MSYNVIWTPDAERDLDEIVSHTAWDLHSPAAAGRLIERMDALVPVLSSLPYAHELSRDEHLAARGYRKAIVGPYVVLHMVDEEKCEVVITNILPTSSNYVRLV